MRQRRAGFGSRELLKIIKNEHPHDNVYHRKPGGKILIDKDIIARVVAGDDDLSIQWCNKAADRNVHKDIIQAALAQDTPYATVWEDPQAL